MSSYFLFQVIVQILFSSSITMVFIFLNSDEAIKILEKIQYKDIHSPPSQTATIANFSSEETKQVQALTKTT